MNWDPIHARASQRRSAERVRADLVDDAEHSKRGAQATSRSTEGERQRLRDEAEEQIRALNARDAREGRWA